MNKVKVPYYTFFMLPFNKFSNQAVIQSLSHPYIRTSITDAHKYETDYKECD